MKINSQSKCFLRISRYFIFSLLGIFSALASSHAMEDQIITNNPNDIVILIDEVTSVKNRVTNIESIQNQFQKNLEGLENRTRILEKLDNSRTTRTETIVEFPTLWKTIQYNPASKIALAGGAIGLATYLYNPTLDSMFIGFYFTTSIYNTIKHFIPNNAVLATSIAGGFFATFLYYSNPILASPFIFLYFVVTIYQMFNTISYYGIVAGSLPI